jgi:hypothetical protein
MEQEQILADFQEQSQQQEVRLQKKLDLYKAKSDQLKELSIQECDILERELNASIQRIRDYKVSLYTYLGLKFDNIHAFFNVQDQLNKRAMQESTNANGALNNLCIICQQEPKQVVFLPCRHLCMCQLCSQAMPRNLCPVCRGTVTGKMGIFS